MDPRSKVRGSMTALDSLFIMLQWFWLLGVGFFAWLLRDGLGPDSVTSEGLHAVKRTFFTFHFGPVCMALLAIDLVWLRRRRANLASTSA